MNQDKYLFIQIREFLNRSKCNRNVANNNEGSYVNFLKITVYCDFWCCYCSAKGWDCFQAWAVGYDLPLGAIW